MRQDTSACLLAVADLTQPLILLAAEQHERPAAKGDEDPWQELALCAQTDPEAFFPEKGGTTAPAKKVCRVCEVRGDCLEYALDHNIGFGVWGGLSERERRQLAQRAAA